RIRSERAGGGGMKSAAGIGGWSARHPRRAIAIWLAFVVLALVFGAATGTKSLDNGAVGESARGYAIEEQERLGEPPREFALIQRSTPAATNKEFAAAAHDVDRRFAALGLEVDSAVSPDGRSVAVTGAFVRPIPVERVRAAVDAVARS